MRQGRRGRRAAADRTALRRLGELVAERAPYTPGEVLVTIGSSGSGKSTLLRTLDVVEEPTAGRVLFRGTELTDVRTDLNRGRAQIGMVFQQFNLLPHRTACQNITLALQSVLGLSRAEARTRALEQLREVGLEHKADAHREVVKAVQ